MIMNLAALLIVNDFDNIVGEYFIQRLDTDISSSDGFMVFQDIQPFIIHAMKYY